MYAMYVLTYITYLRCAVIYCLRIFYFVYVDWLFIYAHIFIMFIIFISVPIQLLLFLNLAQYKYIHLKTKLTTIISINSWSR